MIVCFEGINGAGKSTQIKLLCGFLQSKGISYEVLHDPGVREGHPCQELRPLFVYGDKWSDPRTSLLIGSSARNELTIEIRRIQQQSPEMWIILDRYEMSTYAYQTLMLEDGGFTFDESLDMIRSLHDILRCVTPDLLVLLDTEPEVAYPRRPKGRRVTDKPVDDQFEVRGLAFSRRLAERYIHVTQFAEQDGLYRQLVVVNAGAGTSESDIAAAYMTQIESMTSGRPQFQSAAKI